MSFRLFKLFLIQLLSCTSMSYPNSNETVIIAENPKAFQSPLQRKSANKRPPKRDSLQNTSNFSLTLKIFEINPVHRKRSWFSSCFHPISCWVPSIDLLPMLNPSGRSHFSKVAPHMMEHHSLAKPPTTQNMTNNNDQTMWVWSAFSYWSS